MIRFDIRNTRIGRYVHEAERLDRVTIVPTPSSHPHRTALAASMMFVPFHSIRSVLFCFLPSCVPRVVIYLFYLILVPHRTHPPCSFSLLRSFCFCLAFSFVRSRYYLQYYSNTTLHYYFVLTCSTPKGRQRPAWRSRTRGSDRCSSCR